MTAAAQRSREQASRPAALGNPQVPVRGTREEAHAPAVRRNPRGQDDRRFVNDGPGRKLESRAGTGPPDQSHFFPIWRPVRTDDVCIQISDPAAGKGGDRELANRLPPVHRRTAG